MIAQYVRKGVAAGCRGSAAVLRFAVFFTHLTFLLSLFFFFQAEDGIRDYKVTGVQTCALPICSEAARMIPLSYNVRSILRRRFSAVATAGGLALVVFVFAAVLMLASGVEETLKATGSPRNAILLRKGSSSELTSFLPRDAAKVFAADPSVAVEGGKAIASPELFVIFQLQRSDGKGTANVGFRGVTPDGFHLLRSETVHVVEGRLPQPATSEVMIGRGGRGRDQGAGVGPAGAGPGGGG